MLKLLYDRDCRQPFVDPGVWLAHEIDSTAILRELTTLRLSRSSERILSDVPFLMPFLQRVQILRQLILNDGGLNPGDFTQGVRVQIRRSALLEDSRQVFFRLQEEGRLRERLRITFINQEGLEEAGIDGGGVYKEFLNQLVETAFHGDNGLFLETDNHKLYPNPARCDADSLKLYEMLGMVLGKALFENQLVEIPLASFFLSKLLGKSNVFSDLNSLDEDLAKSLNYLLSCREVDSLGLCWSVSERDPVTQEVRERDLVANGRNIPVTLQNRVHYVFAMANYKLNVAIKFQSRAFVRGFSRLIRNFTVRMFNEAELQMLISGEDGPLNIDAWELAVEYGGGYHPTQPIMQDFWETVRSFTPEQQRKLLKFITSSSFAPLLGFDSYWPPITISKRTGGDQFLPTASTCVNLLKLPEYSSKWVMRERLLYAIESGAGFELS